MKKSGSKVAPSEGLGGKDDKRVVAHLPSKQELEAGAYGEAHTADPNFAPAPVDQRSCTDIIFLLLFMVFWIGMIIVAIKGFSLGDPNRLIYGIDSDGNVCGQTNANIPAPYGVDKSNKSVLFYANPFSTDQLHVCMEVCPTDFPSKNFSDLELHWTGNSLTVELTNTDGIFCDKYLSPRVSPLDDNNHPQPNSNFSLSLLNLPPLPGDPQANKTCYVSYPSQKLANRCIPKVFANVTKTAIMGAVNNAKDVAQPLLADINYAKYIILACCGIALFLGFMWLIFLRFFAGVMVWLTILLLIAAMAALTAFLWVKYNSAKMVYDAAVAANDATRGQYYNYQAMMGLAIVFAIATVGLILLVIFMFNRIRLAIVIIKESATALQSMPLLIFFPVLMFIPLGGFFAYWIALWLWLGSAAEFVPPTTTTGGSWQSNDVIKGLQGYHIFGLLWVTEFVLAFAEMTIAGAIAGWYFMRDKKIMNNSAVLGSAWRTFRFHMGTLAFGSLIIAIVQFIRLLLKYIEMHLKGKDNRVLRLILCCLQCCFWCAEKILKFISRNAYIQTSIYGENFCTAAKNSFQILMRNSFRLVAIHLVGDFVLFLGKVAITAITCIIAVAWTSDDPDINFYIFVVIVIGLLAYCIASAFMAVFEMAINTVFLCFCEDCERNSQSGSYWMSDRLRNFANTHEVKNPDLAK